MKIFEKKEEKEIKNEAKTILPAGPDTSGGIRAGEDARAYQVILAPHQTEKAGLMASLSKYVFRVGANSNKIEIRRAIEKLYKVKVDKVAVLKLPAKARRLGRTAGFRPGFKKAMVTLAAGHKIDAAG